MKKIIFFPLLLLVVVAFVSCSKDKSPAPGQETDAFDIPFNIFVAANATTNTPQTVQLKDVLSATNQDKANYVSSSAILRNQSYISVTGITNTGGTLNNISFTTSDNVIKFSLPVKTISRDTTFYDDAYTDLLKQVGDYMASKRNITLSINYTAGDKNISSGVIDLHVATIFSW